MQKNSELIISLALLQTSVLKRVDNQLSLHGISFSEFMVLHHLNNAPKKTMRRIDLAESIGLSASGVTRLMNPMEKIKLVQKEANPRDARVSLVKLSKAGEQILRDAMVGFNHSADTILKPLNSKQTALYAELTQALL
jgi:DNA-binding MarR family transcriptional regulator